MAHLLPTLDGEQSQRAHVLVASRPRPALALDVPEGHPLRRARERARVLEPFEGAQELADLARQEIHDLAYCGERPEIETAQEVMGLVTAAAGPLSVDDLATLSTADLGSPTAARRSAIRSVVEGRAARSLEPVGPLPGLRYQFAHYSLLQHAQGIPELADPEYRARIDRWADHWRDAAWFGPTGARSPLYLLDAYPATLADDPGRLSRVVGDLGWIGSAVAMIGVDRTLATLRTAAAADPSVAPVLSLVTAQAHLFRPPQPFGQPGYVLRHLCLYAMERAQHDLAQSARDRLEATAGEDLVPLSTTRRTSPALAVELGNHEDWVEAVAVLGDGRVVTGGFDGRVRVWNPAAPGAAVELGTHRGVKAVTVLGDGRVVSGGYDGLALWDLAPPAPGKSSAPTTAGWRRWLSWATGGWSAAGPTDDCGVWEPGAPGVAVELGTQDGTVEAVAVLDDGRVVSGGHDGLALWDLGAPGAREELGTHGGRVKSVAVLSDGRVVSGGADGRVRVWDPAARGAAAEFGVYYDWVEAVAPLGDGRVVSGGDDGLVRLWDPAAPGAAVELGTHRGRVKSVAVLDDGRVVSGGEDGRVRLWDPAAPGATVEVVCGTTRIIAAFIDRAFRQQRLLVAHAPRGLSFWSVGSLTR